MTEPTEPTFDLTRLDQVPPLCPWSNHGPLDTRRGPTCRQCSARYVVDATTDPDVPVLRMLLTRAGSIFTKVFPIDDPDGVPLGDRVRAWLRDPWPAPIPTGEASFEE